MIAASYPFLDLLWTMFIFFAWILWFMLLFRIWGDVFSRSDLSGLGKTGWLVFTILLPFLGVLIYVDDPKQWHDPAGPRSWARRSRPSSRPRA